MSGISRRDLLRKGVGATLVAPLARLAPALERELKETQMRAAHRQAQRDLIASLKRDRDAAAG